MDINKLKTYILNNIKTTNDVYYPSDFNNLSNEEYKIEFHDTEYQDEEDYSVILSVNDIFVRVTGYGDSHGMVEISDIEKVYPKLESKIVFDEIKNDNKLYELKSLNESLNNLLENNYINPGQLDFDLEKFEKYTDKLKYQLREIVENFITSNLPIEDRLHVYKNMGHYLSNDEYCYPHIYYTINENNEQKYKKINWHDDGWFERMQYVNLINFVNDFDEYSISEKLNESQKNEIFEQILQSKLKGFVYDW